MPFSNPRAIASRCSNLGEGVNVRGPLIYDSGAPPLPLNTISLCSPWLPKNGMQGHFSIYIVDYSLQEPHLIL